jgi:hypothetical protein
MSNKSQGLALLLTFALLSRSSAGSDAKTPSPPSATVENARDESAVLWKEPTDIRSRNLFYGPGGERDQPHPPFTFVEEDLKGTSPKYVVRDSGGVKWTVKLGIEARPETVASRLVWAAGYFTNEDYFLQDLQVNGIAAAHLKRGGNLISPGGSMHAARLKRHLKNEKKTEGWKWRDDPFIGSRELNGLKVMMALINNWDLKDDNNGIYAGNDSAGHVYMVSDLGASFGTTGLSFPFSHSKGDLNSFAHSKFIGKVSTEYVEFRTPSRPALIYAFWPPLFLGRMRLDGICHHIPRADARWVGHLLSGLSPDQIRDAFRAAGYTPQQVDGFSKVVEERITELNRL